MSKTMKPEINKDRPIRSFVLRQGRMTPAQQRALETLWPHYGCQVSGGMLDFTTLFENDAGVTLEIGFGMGDSLVELAKTNSDRNYIGVEVHQPGVGNLLNKADEAQLDNLKVFCADAVDVLSQTIPDHSLEAILIFFPDPWHKKRHHKRRLIQPEFVKLLLSKLTQGGILHIATDWQPYAEHCIEVLSQFEQLQNQADSGDYVARPDTRPVTKFERRGERLGHDVFDLVFRLR